MRTRWIAAALASGVVASSVACLLAATPATAASCTAVTISKGQGLTFDVSSVLVTTGGCVGFANLTDVTVNVSVSGSSFSERLPAKTPASASRSFTATKSAGVTASDGIRTGHGSITVQKPVSTPTYIPPPVQSSAPAPTPSEASATPSATASDSATPKTHESHHSAVAVLPALPSLPPGNADAPPAASHPVVAPRVKGTGVAQTAGVLEPASGERRGLPAAVALVALLGLVAAYGRAVLVAAPAVDGRSSRRPSHP
jgi:plastocyanin